MFTDDYYTFILTWRVESTQAYLTEHQKLNFHVNAKEYGYLKHYVSRVDSNVKLVYENGGAADMYVSLNASNKHPNKDEYDFSTVDVMGSNY